MFPFWEVAVAPVLEAAGARRIVEIGALRGENTKLMLDRLGPDTELHVIDPVPDFDPAAHERQFAGRYIFHRDLSLNVLGGLPPMDAAIVDGDHNWYTVYNELRRLSEVSRAAGMPLPVLILHDVGWPYGRRDLYYAPETIPEEFRQPYRRAGMRPGNKRLNPRGGGMNPTLCNAELEGGPRNGVMTALDDFIAEYDKPLRRVVLPIYFGLAIVVEEERLARQPALAAELDRLESPMGKDQLLELSEDIHMSGMIFQHNVFYQKERALDRLAERYLDTVKRGLIDEYYLENELRLAHLADCASNGRPPDADRLRDPVRYEAEDFRRLRARRRTGGSASNLPVPASEYAYAPGGRVALDHLQRCLDKVREDHIPGDVADCGAGRGGAGIFLRAYFDAHDMNNRDVWIADSFRVDLDRAGHAADGITGLGSDLNQVRDAFERFDLLDEHVHFLQGDLEATLPAAPVERLALLHLGPRLGASARAVLEQLYPRLAVGGFVVADDRDDPAVRASIDSYRAAHGIDALEELVGTSGTSWRKATSDAATAPAATEAVAGAAAPVARPVATEPCDLSVVVVVYDMKREAARSLLALSRRYQRGIEDLDYEVVVVENGSSAAQRLGEAYVRGFGPEFRYLDLGEDATPSPARALNRGIEASRGRSIALMIDGAHIVTPGVLRFGMAGLAAYEPAIVATQQWYVGPGQQGEAVRGGYDQTYEDALFEQIAWPDDGYDLFKIGHFIADRDWFDGMWESNCLFVPRKQLEQVGGFDEGFAEAGGGYTNLDLYERLASAPDIEVVTILGEGSFHQVHGGTTTNESDPSARHERVFGYSTDYAELRGRQFRGPAKIVNFVGGFSTDAAKRTRPRRLTAWAFPADPALEGESPDRPVAVPDEIRDGFVDAYWRSGAADRTSWLGQKLTNTPTDLFVYQEIIEELHPDWIIETGTREGGRAMFLASVCDLVGHGRVVSVGNGGHPALPEHPRVSYIVGRSTDAETLAKVREIVGDAPNGMVILGTRGPRQTIRTEFELYKPLVAVGSYAVVEHTVVNGFPVNAAHGPGPHEAVRQILGVHGDFLSDTERDKFALSFNTGGFLRRIR